MTMFIEDGNKPVWQDHQDYPWNEYKHLQRDKFEQLVTMMIDAYPDDPLTEWLKRGFAMNEGDSTISFSSLEGYRCCSGVSIILIERIKIHMISCGEMKKK